MKVLLSIILTGIAVAIAAYLIPGVVIEDFITAIVVAVVLGLVNAFIRPIILLLTLPLNIMTLGLFTFIINALMIMLTAVIVPGFAVSNFWTALLFSIIVSLVKMLFSAIENRPAIRP